MADIIFDVDGTLMDVQHRRHFVEQSPRNFKAFRKAMANDTPNEDIVMMAKLLKEAGHRIIIATGRLQSDRAITLKQLLGAGIVFDAARKFAAIEILRSADFGTLVVTGTDRVQLMQKIESWSMETEAMLDTLRAFEVF